MGSEVVFTSILQIHSEEITRTGGKAASIVNHFILNRNPLQKSNNSNPDGTQCNPGTLAPFYRIMLLFIRATFGIIGSNDFEITYTKEKSGR